MVSSAQKAPVTSAALTVLNLAVVRQVVFERAAEQINEKRRNATEAVVRTAEQNRNRNAVVDQVIKSGGEQRDKANEARKVEASETEFKSPDFKNAQKKTVDIQV